MYKEWTVFFLTTSCARVLKTRTDAVSEMQKTFPEHCASVYVRVIAVYPSFHTDNIFI